MKLSKTDVQDLLHDDDFDYMDVWEHKHKNRRTKSMRTQTGDNKKQGRRRIQQARHAKRETYELE